MNKEVYAKFCRNIEQRLRSVGRGARVAPSRLHSISSKNKSLVKHGATYIEVHS